MKKELANLTILVNSCDAYSDLWDPFFKLFKKYGGELTNCPIVLNTDKANYSYPGLNISCPNHYNNKEPWAKRVKNCLNSITTDYVFFLIDDFFLQANVRIDIFKQTIQWLDKNPNVICFNFIPIESAQTPSAFDNFCELPVGAPYRFNAQAAIWRKEDLNNSMLEQESAWDWEVFGNFRNDIIFENKKIYAISFDSQIIPYNYNFVQYDKSNRNKIVVISAIMRGKWAPKIVDKCFKENGINVDYSIRGIYNKSKKPFFKRVLFRLSIIFKTKSYKLRKAKEQQEYIEKYKMFVTDKLNEKTQI